MSLVGTLTHGNSMTRSALLDEEATSLGRQPSIVEQFTVYGLYGYRSISMSSEYAATILIAKNGSGKTTMLGALDAFLKVQFSRLVDLQFSELRCKFYGYEEDLVLRFEDVIDFMDISKNDEMLLQSKRLDIDLQSLFRFLIEDFPGLKSDYRALNEDKVFQAIDRSVNYNWASVINLCERLRSSAYKRNRRLRHVYEVVAKILKDIEVVYLPTYRRIELAMGSEVQESRPRSRPRRPRFKVTAGSLFKGDIQFGLADISERLAEMNQQILSASNQGYRTISANIINELLDGTFDREASQDTEVPSAEEISLFLTRIREGVGPYQQVSIPDLARAQTGSNVPGESSKFLRYFLAKLGTVIIATRDIEARVEAFVDSCNKYLSARDTSATLPIAQSSSEPKDIDGKVLCLNRKDLSVHVESLLLQRRISIDALSSGEKQMVSLFAKLYLYPSRKIVLIDEPELSLSIDWQRQILIDVLSAPLCLQVVAITHSPFVFDNGLEPFARSLTTSIDEEALSTSFAKVEDVNAPDI